MLCMWVCTRLHVLGKNLFLQLMTTSLLLLLIQGTISEGQGGIWTCRHGVRGINQCQGAHHGSPQRPVDWDNVLSVVLRSAAVAAGELALSRLGQQALFCEKERNGYNQGESQRGQIACAAWYILFKFRAYRIARPHAMPRAAALSAHDWPQGEADWGASFARLSELGWTSAQLEGSENSFN